jgi:peroxiredoxin
MKTNANGNKMALLKSIQIPLGTKMQDFSLKDPNNQSHNLETLKGKKGLLIVITCNHCPYAQAIWERVITLSSKFKPLGINTTAINPNINPNYPEDNPENMLKLIEKLEIKFPYLIDESQQIAKQFKAQCTPDIYLLNNNSELVYHGRVDDNWRDPHAVKNHELQAAMNNLINDLPISKDQKPSIGCSIKWN